MVEKFKTILEEIKRSRGDVVLFALMRMDELTDKWTVILSASWAKEGDLEVFKYILNLIQSNLSKEEFSTIARIGILDLGNSLVKLITGTIRTEGKTIRLQNTKINGFSIQDAHIFQSFLGDSKEILTDKESIMDQRGEEKPQKPQIKKEKKE